MTRSHSASPDETFALGRTFAASLKPGAVVCLSGNLGTGKTQFIKGVCEGLAVRARVTSPTFTIVNEYPVAWGTVVHIDVFRIGSRAEAEGLGLRDYFNERCICLIEWPERIAHLLPVPRIEIVIDYGETDSARELTIREVEGVAA